MCNVEGRGPGPGSRHRTRILHALRNPLRDANVEGALAETRARRRVIMWRRGAAANRARIARLPTGETRRTPPRASRRARGARARSRSRARARQEKEDDSPEIETVDPRRTSGGALLDARATEGETVSRRERGPGRGRAPRRDDVSARRAVSSGPSRALHAGFYCPSRAFLPSGRDPVFTPVPDTCGRAVDRGRPTRSGPGGGSLATSGGGGHLEIAPAVRPRRRPTSSPRARARVSPSRTRVSRLVDDRRAPRSRNASEQAPTLDRDGRGRAPAASSPTDAHGATRPWCEARGAAITARKEGGAPAGFVWDGEVRRGRRSAGENPAGSD